MIVVKRIGRQVLTGFNVAKAINEGHRKSAVSIKKELFKVLTTGVKTGRVYKIGGKLHTASAPGEAPAKLSGKLASSVGYKLGNKRLTVGEGASYAAFLESGTSKMAARSHFQKTVEAKLPELQKHVNESVLKVFK